MHSDLDRPQQPMADRLRRLSAQSHPPYDWLEFQRRAQIRAHVRERRAANEMPYVAAAAALLVLIVGSVVALLNHRDRADVVAQSAPPPAESLRAESDPDVRTRVVERWLAALPPEPVIVRFGTRVAVTRLEDRIAQVDDLLTAANFDDAQPAHLAALRAERGQLVNSLAQVRYAEALAANAP